MARINKGILGSVTGKVGTVIGSSWKGIAYIRSLSSKRKGGSSQRQLEHQARFGLATRFIQSMKQVIITGFSHNAVQMTEMNSALAHILKNAVTGTYPAFRISYPQVQVSRGSLPNVVSPLASAGLNGTLGFSWTDNSGVGKAKAGDKAILVAYCEALNHTLYGIEGERGATTGSLNVAMFAGEKVQTWISFLSMDSKDVATSIYTGEVIVNS